MLKILIAEQSYLVRKGLMHIINQFPEVSHVEVIGSRHGLMELLQHLSPDILIINTAIEFPIAENNLDELLPYKIQIVHIINTALPPGTKDNHISIYDSKLSITEKLTHVVKKYAKEKENDDAEELTTREKLILKHVALGLTNKEIGAILFISTHTVISHRKNITRKLDIKSVSGLTVYAILNGIIKMEDIS